MIYFVKHPVCGYIKIGSSDDFATRYVTLETQYGMLDVLGVMPGSLTDEYRLHRKFRAANIRGVLSGIEWFRPVPELLAYIKANCKPHPQRNRNVKRLNVSATMHGRYQPKILMRWTCAICGTAHERYQLPGYPPRYCPAPDGAKQSNCQKEANRQRVRKHRAGKRKHNPLQERV